MLRALYVCSVQGARQPSPEDLTTRARVRDAAVLRFGRDGSGTPLRTVSADAEVSAGLVIHHFGSQEKLRQACDARVLDDIKRAKRGNLTTATSGRVLEDFSTTEQYAPTFAYVVRSLQHGGPLATASPTT